MRGCILVKLVIRRQKPKDFEFQAHMDYPRRKEEERRKMLNKVWEEDTSKSCLMGREFQSYEIKGV